jgi:hypothetical protein
MLHLTGTNHNFIVFAIQVLHVSSKPQQIRSNQRKQCLFVGLLAYSNSNPISNLSSDARLLSLLGQFKLGILEKRC